MYEDDVTSLKTAINDFVWTHASGSTMLDRAEKLSVDIFELFENLRLELATDKIQAG